MTDAALDLYLGMEKLGKGAIDRKMLIRNAKGVVGNFAAQYANRVSPVVCWAI
jgi:hypothetical protein